MTAVSPQQHNSPAGTADRIRVGWREWLYLPGLQIPRIKAKIDTGARTSALHTYFIEPFDGPQGEMLRFGIHPLQKRNDPAVICESPVKDFRAVSDSGGHREMRYVIETLVGLGEYCWPIEITLTNRDSMRFRMLLGRTALANVAVIPDRSFLFGRRRSSSVPSGGPS